MVRGGAENYSGSSQGGAGVTARFMAVDGQVGEISGDKMGICYV